MIRTKKVYCCGPNLEVFPQYSDMDLIHASLLGHKVDCLEKKLGSNMRYRLRLVCEPDRWLPCEWFAPLPPPRIYVAGAYGAQHILDVLENMRRGMDIAAKLFQRGFAPWTPWHDYHHMLMREDYRELQPEDFYRYGIEWLRVSDYMMVVPQSERSHGTQAEIKFAKEHAIPVFYWMDGAMAPLYDRVWNNWRAPVDE